MKAFVALFAVVATVAAEADPLLLSGLPYAYGGALPYSYGYASLAAPAALPAIPGGYAAAGRYVANSAGVVHVAKREAEADPALLAYSGLPLAYGALPYIYGKSAPCVNNANIPVPCAGGHYLYKREAEADAEADPALLAYSAYSALPYTYGALPYAAYGYSAIPSPAVPAIPGGYAAAGRYVANSAGVVHVAKREAEAEPAVYLSGSILPYAATSYVASGISTLPYAYNYAAVSPYLATHPSNVGICLNYVGGRVPC